MGAVANVFEALESFITHSLALTQSRSFPGGILPYLDFLGNPCVLK